MAEFKKEIRLFDAVMMVSGTMIGSGIFLVSPDMVKELGGAGWLLVAWALTGLITMLGALSYGELAGMMPRAGGQYYYLREAWGRLVAFTYGWTLLLVIQTGTIAAVGVAFAKFTAYFIEWFNEKHVIFQAGEYLNITHAALLAIPVILFLTWLNTRGVRAGKIIQNVFGSTKIIAIIVLVMLGLALASGTGMFSANMSGAWDASTAVKAADGSYTGAHQSIAGMGIVVALGLALVGSLFSSDAWNNISFAGDEIVNPKRTLPMSLAIGTGLVTLLYLLINVVYLMVLPIHGDLAGSTVAERGIEWTTQGRVGVAAAIGMAGQWAGYLMAALIMVSTFSCLNGCILAGARVYYKMADDGLFFKGMGKLNANGVPASALWVQGLWASLLALSGNYGKLLDYVMFAVVLFYIITIAGIFILRIRKPDAERPYKAFGYPVLPALYIGLATAFCGILLIYRPMFAWPGLIIVMTGALVYLFIPKQKQ
jgi:basic amino acid/polyamine antiporter, APA family